jgi:hypothetical protein
MILVIELIAITHVLLWLGAWILAELALLMIIYDFIVPRFDYWLFEISASSLFKI